MLVNRLEVDMRSAHSRGCFTASALLPRAGRAGHIRRSATIVQATSQLVPCKLMGVGSAVPERCLTNKDLESLVDTTDEWIASRTGIRQRHVLGKGESLTELAATASLRAIEMAGLKPEDIDMVILATSTPEDIFGNACMVSTQQV